MILYPSQPPPVPCPECAKTGAAEPAWRRRDAHLRLRWRLLAGEWQAAMAAACVLALPNASQISRIVALTVLARQGEPGADELLDEALTLAEKTGEIQRRGPVRTEQAEAAWLAEDHPRAVGEVQEALAPMLRNGTIRDTGKLSGWLARADPSGYRQLLPNPLNFPDSFLRAPSGDWASAALAWKELGYPYDAALALLDVDESALRSALITVSRLGARPTGSIAARRLRDLGARGIPRGPRPVTRANATNLTARDVEIMPFLAASLRDAEIAGRLFLSTKTVGQHVGSILLKLGVHARTDAAATAERMGIPTSSDQAGSPVTPK